MGKPLERPERADLRPGRGTNGWMNRQTNGWININPPVNNRTTSLSGRPFPRNKAEYTATLVACGWAGAEMEKEHLGRSSGLECSKTPKK